VPGPVFAAPACRQAAARASVRRAAPGVP
jgi:hypothetical protein